MEGVFSLADYRPIAPTNELVWYGSAVITVFEVLTKRRVALCIDCVITLTGRALTT